MKPIGVGQEEQRGVRGGEATRRRGGEEECAVTTGNEAKRRTDGRTHGLREDAGRVRFYPTRPSYPRQLTERRKYVHGWRLVGAS